jgi:hypothetical protein
MKRIYPLTSNPKPPTPQQPLLPGEPNNFTDEQLDKAAQITQSDIDRALARGRRNPKLRALIDAKPTREGRE